MTGGFADASKAVAAFRQADESIIVAGTASAGAAFQIRARESTLYGRWTTNGYDYHVEVQNTSHDPMCVQPTLYPDTGLAYSGTWSGAIASYILDVPAFGAAQTTAPAGTLVNGASRGTMRLGACTPNADFAPGALHVSAYAHNRGTGRFLYFFPKEANGGAAANSW